MLLILFLQGRKKLGRQSYLRGRKAKVIKGRHTEHAEPTAPILPPKFVQARPCLGKSLELHTPANIGVYCFVWKGWTDIFFKNLINKLLIMLSKKKKPDIDLQFNAFY